jgi:heme/copper-type cytochrome/quinol oxidase subunit 2
LRYRSGIQLGFKFDIKFILHLFKKILKYQCIREDYKVLISCAKAIASDWKVWIPIIMIIVIIAIVLVISAIFVYFKRKPKIQAITNTSESQTTEALSNYGTLKTIDSKTGYPIGI